MLMAMATGDGFHLQQLQHGGCHEKCDGIKLPGTNERARVRVLCWDLSARGGTMISLLYATLANAESFRVQCPSATTLHPANGRRRARSNARKSPAVTATPPWGTVTRYTCSVSARSPAWQNLEQGLPGTVPAVNFQRSERPECRQGRARSHHEQRRACQPTHRHR